MQKEYSEEYTQAERIRFVVIGVVVGAALIFSTRRWFFPWLEEFSGRSPCIEFWGVNGTAWLLYGIFVGLPLLCVTIVGIPVGWRGHKILRDGRMPPKGEKSFRPIRINYGRKAKFWGWAHYFPVAFFLGLSVWGAVQAHELLLRFEGERAAHECTEDAGIL